MDEWRLNEPSGERSGLSSPDLWLRLVRRTDKFAGALTNSFQYTARENDTETGLYYYRARYYDPSAGRFLNEDPIGFSGGSNFYSYVSGDPTSLVDLLGFGGTGTATAPAPIVTPTEPVKPSVPSDPVINPKLPTTSGGSIIGNLLDDAVSLAGNIAAATTIMLLSPQNAGDPALDYRPDPSPNADRDREYNAYKKRCNEPPPGGLDPCAQARWKLQRNIDCRNMRKNWDDKWYPGRHTNDIDNLDIAIQRLKDWIAKNCKNDCK